MNKEFVTYDIALKLKKLGFDEECFGFFMSKDDIIYPHMCKNKPHIENLTISQVVCAPLWQQVFDWLEKEKKYIITNELYYSLGEQRWGIADVFNPDFEDDALTVFYDSKIDAMVELISTTLDGIKK